MAAVSLICKLFGALVLAVDAAPYFRCGDARNKASTARTSAPNNLQISGVITTIHIEMIPFKNS